MKIEELEEHWKDHTGIYPQELMDKDTQDALQIAKFEPYVMILKKDFRERIVYFGDLLVQMTFKMNKEGKAGALAFKANSIAQALSYLLNCSSFFDGELHDYDLKEINRKLGTK